MDQDVTVIVVLGVALIGMLATVGYYFARFYFKEGQEDQHSAHGEFESESREQERVQSETRVEEETTQNVMGADRVKGAESTVVDHTPKPEKDIQPVVIVKKELKDALRATKSTLFGKLKSVFSAEKTLDEDDIESLEEVLYTSDLGPSTVTRLVESVNEQLSKEEKTSLERVCHALRVEMSEILSSTQVGLDEKNDQLFSKNDADREPVVWMIVGVNGAGKTTTIGKLAHQATASGLKTMVVAGDRFRAAAEDQLRTWAERAGAEIFDPTGVKDPSAVIFDALSMAKSKQYDLVIVDTAGRLHTQDNLMEELKKMKRVMQKVMPSAPHETLIVLDANSGQNALIQTEKFHQALELSGAILTKLDGSAKGGVAVGLAYQYQLPIRLIGVGEGIEDLRTFHAKEFAESII